MPSGCAHKSLAGLQAGTLVILGSPPCSCKPGRLQAAGATMALVDATVAGNSDGSSAPAAFGICRSHTGGRTSAAGCQKAPSS